MSMQTILIFKYDFTLVCDLIIQHIVANFTTQICVMWWMQILWHPFTALWPLATRHIQMTEFLHTTIRIWNTTLHRWTQTDRTAAIVWTNMWINVRFEIVAGRRINCYVKRMLIPHFRWDGRWWDITWSLRWECYRFIWIDVHWKWQWFSLWIITLSRYVNSLLIQCCSTWCFYKKWTNVPIFVISIQFPKWRKIKIYSTVWNCAACCVKFCI